MEQIVLLQNLEEVETYILELRNRVFSYSDGAFNSQQDDTIEHDFDRILKCIEDLQEAIRKQ